MRGDGVHVTVREPVLVSDKFLFLLSTLTFYIILEHFALVNKFWTRISKNYSVTS